MIGIAVCLATQAFAGDSITLNVSTWTQRQKNRAKAIAYSLAYEAGYNVIPTITKDGDNITLQYEGLPVDISVILPINATLLNAIVDAETELAANAVVQEAAYQSARTSLINRFKSLGFTNGELKAMYRTLSEPE